VKVKAGNSNVRETTKTESPFDLLPFGDFIALLKSEGFIIDLKDFAEFTRVFESFSEDTKLFSHSLPEEENDDPRRKLKYYLAPLVCRNETEQKKFYQSFDNFFITKQGGVVSAQATTAEKKKWWKNRLLLIALGCVVLGVAVWYLTRPPQPVNPPEGWRLSPEAPSLREVHRSVAVPKTLSFWRKMLAFSGPGCVTTDIFQSMRTRARQSSTRNVCAPPVGGVVRVVSTMTACIKSLCFQSLCLVRSPGKHFRTVTSS